MYLYLLLLSDGQLDAVLKEERTKREELIEEYEWVDEDSKILASYDLERELFSPDCDLLHFLGLIDDGLFEQFESKTAGLLTSVFALGAKAGIMIARRKIIPDSLLVHTETYPGLPIDEV